MSAVVPRQPSNRQVILQMVKWGWTPGRKRGTKQVMIGPPVGAMKGVELLVAAGHQHESNPTTVFMEIVKLTTSGDLEAFWAGPPDLEAWADMVSQAEERERRNKEAAEAAEIAAMHERAQRSAVTEAARKRRDERVRAPIVVPGLPPAPTQERKPRNPRKEEPVPQGTRNSEVLAKDVLRVLIDNDRPMDSKSIANALGIEPSTKNLSDITNRGGYLTGRGLAVRVMNGTYRASTEGHAVAARIQHTVTQNNNNNGAAAFAPPAPSITEIITHPKVLQISTESIDDNIEAVLDLLLPDGFKAADLRFIAPWIEATKTMINQVKRS